MQPGCSEIPPSGKEPTIWGIKLPFVQFTFVPKVSEQKIRKARIVSKQK